MSYLLDLKKLEPGDIILESGTEKFSEVIKKVTFSNYSHAMLYIGDSIIHALTDGVYSQNPERLIVKNISDLKVLRLKNELKVEQLNKVIMHARNLTGSLYSFCEAGLSPVLGKVKADVGSNKQFCSRLVAQCFKQVDVLLVKNPDFCSPADISKSDLLIEVESCVKKASIKQVEFAKSENPIIENQRRAFDWLNKARVTFKSEGVDIQTLGDVDKNIHNHPNLDKEISGFIKESKYLEHFDVDKNLNSFRYSYDEFKSVISQYKDQVEILERELDSVLNEIGRHSKSFLAAKSNYKYLNLEYNELMIELYKNLLGMSYSRLEVMAEYAKSISENDFEKNCNILLNEIKNLIK
jgi:Permuted papain-like amidase enzyme, YaeF/YiiX, C92 family